MRKFQIISWTILLLGIILKLLQIFGSGELLLLGTILILIHSFIYLFKHAKTDLAASFINLSFAFWTVYLFTRLQYMSYSQGFLGFPIVFIIPFLVTLTCFILHLTSKTKFKLTFYLLTIYFAFSLFLSFTHSDRIYYFFNLNTVLNSESRNTDFAGWDKYSWFLYLADKKVEAAEANQKAEKANSEYLKLFPDNQDAIQYSTQINIHRQKILEQNWTTYP